MSVSATLDEILNETAYERGPVTFTVRLTGGFSFARGSMVQEKVIVRIHFQSSPMSHGFRLL